MASASISVPQADFVRRQRFRLGEYRRQKYRDLRFLEASRSSEMVGRAPDYVGVGVQRAGTSRWHQLITAHPDVVEVTDPKGRTVKEIHWFDDPQSDSSAARDAAYRMWFQVSDDVVVGEWTPRYLFDLWPIDRLKESCPDTKLIVMLRDPMTRLRSALQFYSARGVPLGRDTIRESIWRGMYGAQLEYLFDRWPRERVFVGLYEDGVAEPEKLLVSLYDFLGLDSTFRPDELDRRVNESKPTTIDESIILAAETLYRRDRPAIEAALPDTNFSRWT